MKDRKRYVFDTNVIVSALLFKQSTPGQAFHTALDHGSILISWPTLKELVEVLNRKKFDRYLLQEEKECFLDTLVQETILIEITENVSICRDPKDNKFLELAISGDAACIVSGDNDLLDIGYFRGTPIIKPDKFLVYLIAGTFEQNERY
jgi:putative PIN family toxin of toxin-antitoxin system